MFEAFKIGVKLSLVNEVSHGLLAMANDFNRAEHHLGSLQKKLNQMSASAKLAFGGAVSIGIGASIALALKPALDEARKFETAKANFGLLGLTPEQNQSAFDFARAMNVAGSSYVENLQKMTEAQGVFREAGLKGNDALVGAKLAAPMLAKLSVLAKMQGHEMSEADDKNLLRAGEISGGLKDAKTFNERAETMFKIVGSSGGNVGYRDLFQFYSHGSVAAKSLTDEALMKLEPVIGELKGAATGTGLMTAYGRMNGMVRLPNQVAHDLVKMGVWDGSKITWNRMGGIKSINSNPLKSANLLQSDPVEWDKEVLEPMFARLGITSQNAKNVELGKLFSRSGAKIFALMETQAATIARSPMAIKQHLGIDQSLTEESKTFNGQLLIASQNWKNLLNNIGTAILPTVNAGLTTLNGFLQRAADFTRDNPGIVKAGAYIAVIGAGLLVFGGIVALLAAGITAVATPIGLAIAGTIIQLAAMGAAFVWLKNLDWKGVWVSMKNSIIGFINWIGDAWKHRAKWLGGDGTGNNVVVGVNGATRADKDYNDAISGSSSPSPSKYVKYAPKTPVVIAYSDFGNGFEKGVTRVVGGIVSQSSMPLGSGLYDSGLSPVNPGQGY